LVLFPGALGDLLLLAPAVTALARGGVLVDVSVTRALGDLAAALLAPAMTGPAADGRVVGSLFGGMLDPVLVAWLRGADVVHAFFGAAAADDLVRHCRDAGVAEVECHHVVRDDGPMHAAAEYARALAVAWPQPMPMLRVGGLPRTARQRLVVHPGAGAPAKRWSPVGFAALADRWRARGGETAVLLGPAEREEAAEWRASADVIVDDAPLMDVATLLAGGACYVGNDSGISHLAGAVGCRGAVLFGPTRPERWRPIGGALRPVRFDDAPVRDIVERTWRALERAPLP
jgi:heptosyltransferase III